MTTLDIVKVCEHLYFGAMPPNGSDLSSVCAGAHVFVCMGEIGDPQNLRFEGASCTHVPVFDNDLPLHPMQRVSFMNTAEQVAERLKKGMNTIVMCRAGMNRSALVCALALKMMGSDPEEIIGQLRKVRGVNQVGEFPLFNRHFENAVRHDMPAGTISHEDSALVWSGEAWEPHGSGKYADWNKPNWPILHKTVEGKWLPFLFLFISTPVYDGSATNTYMRSIVELARALQPLGVNVYFSWPRGDGIARCRNRQIAEFLASPATHYCCVDADIGFTPQHLIDMVTCNLDIVFGAYPAKGYEWQNVIDGVTKGTIKTPADAEKSAVRFVVNYKDEAITSGQFSSIKMDDGRLFVEIKEGSTGFMVVRRNVIEKMIAEYPERCYQDDYPGPTRGTRMFDLFHMGMDPTSHTETIERDLKKAALKVASGEGEVGELVKAAKAFKDARADIVGGSPDVLPRYLSEDYGFCRLWQMMGGKIFLYTGAQLSHTGIAVYEGKISDQFQMNPQVQPQNPQGATVPVLQAQTPTPQTNRKARRAQRSQHGTNGAAKLRVVR